MSKVLIEGLKESFPNAVLNFDHVHVFKLMNDVLVKIRAEAARQFPEALRKTRYLLLKSPAYSRLSKSNGCVV